MRHIPYGRQTITDEDVAAVVNVLQGDWLTTGPDVRRFELALAERVGAKYAVAFSSGTAALHAAYAVAGVKQGDEVITTPLTFAATANAALYVGAKPVFVDIETETGNIDVSLIPQAVTNRTRVIAPVDYAGHPVDLDEIMNIASDYGLVVVEDACHALGAVYKGRPIGSLAHMTVFSFHPVKHITTGEGGAVVTNDPAYYERLLVFRNHGITRDRNALTRDEGPWYYEMQMLGYNYRITDIQCALGAAQLAKLDRFLERRREIVRKYGELLSGLELELPVEKAGASSAWHLYVVRLRQAAVRRAFVERMHARGIGVQVHYIPVYWHPYYQSLGYRRGQCPRAEDFYSRCASLPIYSSLKDEELMRVADSVVESLAMLRA